MKKLFTLCGLLLASIPLAFSQTSGGPDAYGYTWRDSNDPNGPTYAWLNIQDVGVQVTGLTDDNASSIIPMNMDFHYYWYDVDQIKIGSNGWISFNNVSNIAHCFPQIPVAGGSGDNYMAPFMTDLIMNAAGTNAQVYYWFDSGNDRFVISYIDVPWWQQAAPGYVGLNTFQVILSNQDSSITFQYKELDQAALADNAGCLNDLVIGMENITGNIGLGLGQFTEVVPNDLYAIKFYPPAEALISIPDLTPLWNENVDNKGVFIRSGEDHALSTTVKNVGNADISTSITVNSELENLAFVSAYTNTDVFTGLAAGASVAVDYANPVNLSPGQYYFNVTTANSSDINPGNNNRVTELNAVDISQTDVLLSFATQNLPDGNVGWTGGGGMGVYIEPPAYPATLVSTDVWVTSGINGADAFSIQILDTDGVNGLPGTILQQVDVPALSYLADTWVNVPLTSPYQLSSGGVYVAFIHGADGVFLGTESAVAGPVSRQTYEYVGGSWATYRENTNAEMLINSHFSFLGVGMDEVGADEFQLFPNPSNGTFELRGDLADKTIEVLDAIGRSLNFERSYGADRINIQLDQAAPGMYFVRISGQNGSFVNRILVN